MHLPIKSFRAVVVHLSDHNPGVLVALVDYYKGRPLGTFLLRFSGSAPDKLAVSAVIKATDTTPASATEALRTENYLIGFDGGYCALIKRGQREEYPTLAALVRDSSGLKLIEPDVPKALAFRSDARGGSWNRNSCLQGGEVNSGHASANQQQTSEPS